MGWCAVLRAGVPLALFGISLSPRAMLYAETYQSHGIPTLLFLVFDSDHLILRSINKQKSLQSFEPSADANDASVRVDARSRLLLEVAVLIRLIGVLIL